LNVGEPVDIMERSRMRLSASATSLPALPGGGRNPAGLKMQPTGHKPPGGKRSSITLMETDPVAQQNGGRLELSASAPSLSSISQVRDGVERVVAKLTERPGIGPLLLLHDQEHGAHILKALSGDKKRKGPAPPRLLMQPPIAKGSLGSLQRRSNILSDIADQMGATSVVQHALIHDDDDEAGRVDSPISALSGSEHAQHAPTMAGAPALRLQRSTQSNADAPSELASVARPRSRLSRAGTPLGGPTSSLHAARAAAAKSAALLDTRMVRTPHAAAASRALFLGLWQPALFGAHAPQRRVLPHASSCSSHAPAPPCA
jgi:hypothetical protein